MAEPRVFIVLCGLLVLARLSICEDKVNTGTFSVFAVKMWFQTKFGR